MSGLAFQVQLDETQCGHMSLDLFSNLQSKLPPAKRGPSTGLVLPSQSHVYVSEDTRGSVIVPQWLVGLCQCARRPSRVAVHGVLEPDPTSTKSTNVPLCLEGAQEA